ncbi:hypothetical protein AVEN_183733-1 [Araneus ventricosus]|uniref:Uncharacterized protein n=1 Tax=Araneus ventricosus TaxID=182803 RepID=A0A4Y2IYD9_ARAVE|nr:hypothetical protein AVEN_183733-1 [Araneus ventricosus]
MTGLAPPRRSLLTLNPLGESVGVGYVCMYVLKAGGGEWSKEYSKRTQQNTSAELYDIPPVRGQKISEMQPQSASDNGKQKNNETKHKICKQLSYQEWNKFDVEGELEKLEDKDETGKTENEPEEKIRLDTSIPATGKALELNYL